MVIPVEAEKMGLLIGKQGVVIKGIIADAKREGLELELNKARDGSGNGEVKIKGPEGEAMHMFRMKIIDTISVDPAKPRPPPRH